MVRVVNHLAVAPVLAVVGGRGVVELEPAGLFFLSLVEAASLLLAEAVDHNLEQNCERDEHPVRVPYLLPAEAIDQPNFVVHHRRSARGLAVSAAAILY